MYSKLEDSTNAYIIVGHLVIRVYLYTFFTALPRRITVSLACASRARTVEVSVFPRRYVSVFASRDVASIRTFSRGNITSSHM